MIWGRFRFCIIDAEFSGDDFSSFCLILFFVHCTLLSYVNRWHYSYFHMFSSVILQWIHTIFVSGFTHVSYRTKYVLTTFPFLYYRHWRCCQNYRNPQDSFKHSAHTENYNGTYVRVLFRCISINSCILILVFHFLKFLLFSPWSLFNFLPTFFCLFQY